MTEPPLVRTSERKLFRACPQAWVWSYRYGLTPKGQDADALWFGTGIHHALAKWYQPGFRRGPHPSDTFAAWVGDEVRTIKASFADREREWHDEQLYLDARDLAIGMLDAYVARYGKDPDLYILAVEQVFEIEVVRDGEVIAVFKGTVDGLARLPDGTIVVLEHKTASSIATEFLALDDQAGGYYAVAEIVFHHQGILKPSEHVTAIMYNYLRKSLPDDRPEDAEGRKLNVDGQVSKRQPPRPFVREFIDRSPAECNTQMRRLADEVVLMNKMRRGELPVIKNTNWQCPRCSFFQLCVLDEKGNKHAAREFMKSEYVVRDPYKPYRKSTSELWLTTSRSSRSAGGRKTAPRRPSSSAIRTARA
jgi:hypothetical protein